MATIRASAPSARSRLFHSTASRDARDSPRAGVSLIRGQPHYFLAEFSEALDDYLDEYLVWPIEGEALQRALAAWGIFASWRMQLDSGIDVPPLEENQEFVALNKSLEGDRVAPADALLALPRWRLDSNRSFRRGSLNTRSSGLS